MENKEEIIKYKNKLLIMYEPVKIKLEEIMISKEELKLNVPQIDLFYGTLGETVDKLQKTLKENNELENNVKCLSQNYQKILEINNLKKINLHEQSEKFEARLALMRVQERFINEKNAKFEMFGKELSLMNSAIDQANESSIEKKPSCNNKPEQPKIKSKSAIRVCKSRNSKTSINKSLYK